MLVLNHLSETYIPKINFTASIFRYFLQFTLSLDKPFESLDFAFVLTF